MRPLYDIYLLEVEWTWDHCNTELATLTVEGRAEARYEQGFDILGDPAASAVDKKIKVDELKEIAHALRRQNPHDDARLVRLYRVTDYVRPNRERLELHMQLEPICEFDSEGNPFVLNAAT